MLLESLATDTKTEASAHPGAISIAAVGENSAPKVKVKRRQESTFRKGQKIRIFPSEKQNQHFEAQQKHLSTGSLSRELTELRQTPELDWLGLVPRTALTQTGFFDGIKDKRLDSPGKPQFRAKCGSRESATFPVDARHEKPYRFEKAAGLDQLLDQMLNCFLSLARAKSVSLGWVKAFFSEPVIGEVSSITVKQEWKTWVASFSLINIEQTQLHRNTGKKADKKIEFDFPRDDPTCLINNPHREGLAAIMGGLRNPES